MLILAHYTAHLAPNECPCFVAHLRSDPTLGRQELWCTLHGAASSIILSNYTTHGQIPASTDSSPSNTAQLNRPLQIVLQHSAQPDRSWSPRNFTDEWNRGVRRQNAASDSMAICHSLVEHRRSGTHGVVATTSNKSIHVLACASAANHDSTVDRINHSPAFSTTLPISVPYPI